MSKDLKRNRGLGHGTQRDCGLLAADAGIMFDRSWIFRPDPDFRDKAGLALDLYELRFEGRLLHPGELVISADERSQLQALGRRHDTELPGPGRPVRSDLDQWIR